MASSLWLMWQAAPLLKKLMSNFPSYILGYKRYKAAWPVQTYIHILNVFSALTRSTYLLSKMEILLQLPALRRIDQTNQSDIHSFGKKRLHKKFKNELQL